MMHRVVRITFDGNSIGEPADFLSAFFHAMAGADSGLRRPGS
jgi:hypothetical protein